MHSNTNADVLKTQHLDTVIVVSSMSASRGRATGPDAFLRWSVHRRLEREIAHLEAGGTTVVRLEPGPETRQAMGLWAMAEHRAPKVVEAAYEETRNRIHANPFLAANACSWYSPSWPASVRRWRSRWWRRRCSAPRRRRRLIRPGAAAPGRRAPRAAHQEKLPRRGGTVPALRHRSPS